MNRMGFHGVGSPESSTIVECLIDRDLSGALHSEFFFTMP
jgi:hypothetical protein